MSDMEVLYVEEKETGNIGGTQLLYHMIDQQ
jgi:hypothetical protein